MITFEEAMDAVSNFELMAYFGGLSEGARTKIAEELMAMVNWPPNRPLRNGLGDLIPYVEPIDRLRRLIRMLKTVNDWPGMANIRGLYCKMYCPADGIDLHSCTIPGFTDEECESSTDYLSLERAKTAQQKFIPAPDDEPIGDELQKQIAKAAGKLRGE